MCHIFDCEGRLRAKAPRCGGDLDVQIYEFFSYFRSMKQLLVIILRALGALLILALLIITASSISPIYRFGRSKPFAGPDIYNPYEGASGSWQRACFHTHTKVDGLLNECSEWPDSVYAAYKRLGYDIIAFSNHNRLTRHPSDSSLQISVYEHGYNIAKYHKLVFNPGRVRRFDHILPVLASQKQWQLDLLSRDADFIALAHPDRTSFVSARTMRLLTGYRFIEADCNYSTDLMHWDEALSAGHYSHNLLGDDCHDVRNHAKIARRCSWINCASPSYEDVAPALMAGRFFSMRIPDFGEGDWNVKYAENARLPQVEAIGVEADSVYLRLSAPARIEAIGQGHTVLAEATGNGITYKLGESEPYVRFTAYFDNGVVLYTNAFARFNARITDTPYVVGPHKVSTLLTVLFNLLLLVLLVLELVALRFVLTYKKKKTRLTVEQLRFRGIVP